MSYSIEPLSIISFLDENKMKLPRFQRKATWDKKQNFELAISVFQDYPVGVVIVNKEKDSSWLLDGRQRRNALNIMRSNPVELYEWARNYIVFSKNEDESDLKRKYWDKVESYLSTDISPENNENDNNYYGDESEEIQEPSFDSDKQRKGLTTLLNLILMVHQNKQSGSRWEKNFDFGDLIQRAKYIDRKTKKVNPILLREAILDMSKSLEKKKDAELSKEFFFEYYDENYTLDDNKIEKLKTEITKRWTDIINSIELIAESEKIFSEARIGIIWLTNASPLDAQNIFSRINKGGTQLKAEELLSAKPYWNKEVIVSDAKVKKIVEEMYEKLEVSKPESIVRWDIAATLVSRIKDNGLIFEKHDDEPELSMDQVTLGFKLISSILGLGMSAKSVIALEDEKQGKIDWENDIPELVDDLNTLCEILCKTTGFGTLSSWKMPIMKMLGNAIGLEFLTITYLNWVKQGKPTVSSTEYKTVQRDAIILFDRLVFEYGTKVWRGSGDSKMANDIANWEKRLLPIGKAEWAKFIDGACNGQYNGQLTTVKLLRPILYYYSIIKGKLPINEVDTKFDVDHIIPQEMLKNNSMINPELKDSLGNLALLPKKGNISKSSKTLIQMDKWLEQPVSNYAGIKVEDFKKYSDVSNLQILIDERKVEFLQVFDSGRDTLLSN